MASVYLLNILINVFHRVLSSSNNLSMISIKFNFLSFPMLMTYNLPVLKSDRRLSSQKDYVTLEKILFTWCIIRLYFTKNELT